ncbi:MAG TPA: hypothetical protein VEU33_37940 [Archangium sp.]|nr:hypothetical protein [Archangium sp.]
MALSKLFQEALDSILAGINKSTGLAHPNDLDKAVEMFRQLLGEGEQTAQDEIYHYIVNKQVTSDDAAMEIQRVWEVLERTRRPLGSSWKPDIIEILRERAKKRP